MQEIVIDIPDDLYYEIQAYKTIFDEHNSELATVINDGKLLPKGHGRLIDADVFEKRLMDPRLYYVGEKAVDVRFASGLKSAAKRLVDAPTIIEAKRSEE